MKASLFCLFVILSIAYAAADEKVTVGFTCDELQQQRDTHEAKFGI